MLMNTAKIALFLFALLLFRGAVLAAQQPPQFLFAPGTDPSKFDTQFWMSKVWPLVLQITQPRQVPSQITLDIGPKFTQYSCSTQTMDLSGYPSAPSDLRYYFTLTHELMHALSCQGNTTLFWNAWIEEGMAEARAVTIYRMLGFDMTYVRIADTLNNLNYQACAGTNFYAQNCFPYPTSAGLLEMVAARLGSFKPIDQIRNNLTPDSSNSSESNNSGNEVIDLLNAQFPNERIDGLSLAAYLKRNLTLVTTAQDGDFVAAFAVDGGTQQYTPVNPRSLDFWYTHRQNGAVTRLLTPNIKWWIISPQGNTIAQGVATVMGAGRTPPLASYPTDGLYILLACGTTDNGSSCSTPVAKSQFAVWRKAGDLLNGKLFLFLNGTEDTGLQLTTPDSGLSVQSAPGLLYVEGAAGKTLTFSNGRKTITVTVHPQVTTVKLATQVDQPRLGAVTNGASFKAGSLVPGSIATLFGNLLTHDNPVLATALPLPKTATGATVVIKVSGQTWESPLFYGSGSQFNFQSSWSLPLGSSAEVLVRLNNTDSNSLFVPVVASDAGVFVVDWNRQIGAVLRANTSQLITPEAPAKSGEVLSLFATGLGSVTSRPPDGSPAQANPMSVSLATPQVTMDGQVCEVLFSGLAPGFVGLYQVNFRVPVGMTAGQHNLKLGMSNGSSSNTTKLAVQ